jgi:glycosyltransferase involved in cell wall biosynthesis
MITALARAGETVHLVCQENHPDLYDAIAESWKYDSSGNRTAILKREVPFPGRCVTHQPWIGETLPVFVWDKYEQYSRVVPMVELSNEDLETYLHRNVAVVNRIVREYGITAIHANHAVLMSVVAQRVSRETGVPFTVMPHGSDIEYAVKKDPRFLRYATSAFTDAKKIFVIGDEMRQRVNTVLSSVPDLDAKCVELHLGVDTSQFDPIPRERRPENIRFLNHALAGLERSKPHEYNTKAPDADVEAKLATIDWAHDPTLLFAGRIIPEKGIHSVIAALPLILERVPDLKLIIVGHGPFRDAMEAFVNALERGDRATIEEIVQANELNNATAYYSHLATNSDLDRYFMLARQHVRPQNVIFTGYLTHHELRFLFPCCDVGVFPSVVREAGPLVFLEALASGCFPLGTYFGGMKASIDAVAEVVPSDVADAMKLSLSDTIADIAAKVPRALQVVDRSKDSLTRLAEARYDWKNVALTFLREIDSIE